jgi:hypothetical protein
VHGSRTAAVGRGFRDDQRGMSKLTRDASGYSISNKRVLLAGRSQTMFCINQYSNAKYYLMRRIVVHV